MPYAFVIYPTPVDATVTLTPDSGGSYTGVPYTHTSGRQGQVCYVSDETPDQQGTTLNVSAPNYLPSRLRGFLVLDSVDSDDVARLQVDDVALDSAGAPPPTTTPPSGPPNPGRYHATARLQRDASATVDERGLRHLRRGLLRARCTAKSSPYWGHVKKFEGQNQYNGHAVDAITWPSTSRAVTPVFTTLFFRRSRPKPSRCSTWPGPPEYEQVVLPGGGCDQVRRPCSCSSCAVR